MTAPRNELASPWMISVSDRIGLPCQRQQNNAEVPPASLCSKRETRLRDLPQKKGGNHQPEKVKQFLNNAVTFKELGIDLR
ncbi:hypothetical protein PoB_005853000 [Plakobranchus ocellatus]|uniref:Uncharacterized protein n=1 Tax=Plakobranchus ocellatus TaxID=259542 RepID=A0AAV4CK96_9GAST|nr:hypothetical protein PoB_005853000 [Plakobranchus ocellatus]